MRAQIYYLKLRYLSSKRRRKISLIFLSHGIC